MDLPNINAPPRLPATGDNKKAMRGYRASIGRRRRPRYKPISGMTETDTKTRFKAYEFLGIKRYEDGGVVSEWSDSFLDSMCDRPEIDIEEFNKSGEWGLWKAKNIWMVRCALGYWGICTRCSFTRSTYCPSCIRGCRHLTWWFVRTMYIRVLLTIAKVSERYGTVRRNSALFQMIQGAIKLASPNSWYTVISRLNCTHHYIDRECDLESFVPARSK